MLIAIYVSSQAVTKYFCRQGHNREYLLRFHEVESAGWSSTREKISSFTLEASFCGDDFGRYAGLQFKTDILQEIGHRFCETVLKYCQVKLTVMKSILDDDDNELINNEVSAAQTQNGNEKFDKEEAGGGSAINGLLNGNAGGGLGMIKDEYPNSDSDFCGDEGT